MAEPEKSIEEIRNEINEKIDKIIFEKYPDVFFSTNKLLNDTGESDSEILEIFHFLFSLGEDAKIYLWNHFLSTVRWGRIDLSQMSKDDFTNEEWEFIESIFRQNLENVSRLGTRYAGSVNINHFTSKRISLIPWTSELEKEYIDHFLSEREEYELYYGADSVSDERIKECGQQTYRPLAFAIKLNETNELIGSTGISLIRNDAFYNLEYYIFPKYRHNGYAYEAVDLLIDKAKNHELKVLKETLREGVYEEEIAPVKCLEATIRDNNIASIKLVEKLGFRKDGIIPFFEKHHDTYYDGCVYHYIV